MPSPDPSWSKADDAVLRRHYRRAGTAGVRKHLPHRSPRSVEARAAKLGLTRRAKWTDEELRLLAELAGTASAAKLQAQHFPSRSVEAVKDRLKRINSAHSDPAADPLNALLRQWRRTR
jgi:hypothetical protein